jgi:hypothetical protein
MANAPDDRTTQSKRESPSTTWGTTPAERAMPFPCDTLLSSPDAALYRGVSIAAPAARVFRWLCQLRVAPYSYDWIDNRGRRSPRHLIPGLEQLAGGQDVMGIFTLVDYRAHESLTIRSKPGTAAWRIFGDVVGTYLLVPQGPARCRLLVKLLARYPAGAIGAIMARLLPWGDLVMMRRQLLNLKALAENSGEDA